MCQESDALFYPFCSQIQNQQLGLNKNDQQDIRDKLKIQQQKHLNSKPQVENTINQKQIKCESDPLENDNCQKKKKRKPKSTDPSEHDLCQAILLIKKKLPNRSLERVIKRLFQRVQEQQKRNKFMKVPNKNNTKVQDQPAYKNLTEIVSCQNSSQLSEKQSRASSNGQTIINDAPLQPRPQKILLAGRKASCYHDNAGQIAALSHQFYKVNRPTVQQLQAIQNNLTKLPIFSKPRPETIAVLEENLQKSAINNTKRRRIIFHFKQSQTLKTSFLNPSMEQMYKQKRELTQIFLSRGVGITKKIDNELPKLNMSLDQYKVSLLCVITEAYRRVQSFISKECQRTIKYIDQQQMRWLHKILLHCRVNLSPQCCQTFFKFFRICFGLGDVSISDDQGVQLYVNIQRYLFGKNVTMEMLQNMGRVNNRRQLQSVMKQLSQQVAHDQQRNSKFGSSKYGLSQADQAISQEKKQDMWHNDQGSYSQKIDNINIIPQLLTINRMPKYNYQLSQSPNQSRDNQSNNNNFDIQCSDLMISSEVGDQSTIYMLPDYTEFVNSSDWYFDQL